MAKVIISARGAPCNGQELAQQQAGLFPAYLANNLLTKHVSGVEIQTVAMLASGYGASGVYDFAHAGSHSKNPNLRIAPETCARPCARIAVYLNLTWSLSQLACPRRMKS